MSLYTKSIESKKAMSDGERICIMRNPKGYEGKYDKWMPELSPSLKLREQVKSGIGWEEFKKKFAKELEQRRVYLRDMAKYAETHDVTLMCIEDNPEYCHRSLVAQEIKKLNPKLKVKIK